MGLVDASRKSPCSVIIIIIIIGVKTVVDKPGSSTEWLVKGGGGDIIVSSSTECWGKRTLLSLYVSCLVPLAIFASSELPVSLSCAISEYR